MSFPQNNPMKLLYVIEKIVKGSTEIKVHNTFISELTGIASVCSSSSSSDQKLTRCNIARLLSSKALATSTINPTTTTGSSSSVTSSEYKAVRRRRKQRTHHLINNNKIKHAKVSSGSSGNSGSSDEGENNESSDDTLVDTSLPHCGRGRGNVGVSYDRSWRMCSSSSSNSSDVCSDSDTPLSELRGVADDNNIKVEFNDNPKRSKRCQKRREEKTSKSRNSIVSLPSQATKEKIYSHKISKKKIKIETQSNDVSELHSTTSTSRISTPSHTIASPSTEFILDLASSANITPAFSKTSTTTTPTINTKLDNSTFTAKANLSLNITNTTVNTTANTTVNTTANTTANNTKDNKTDNNATIGDATVTTTTPKHRPLGTLVTCKTKADSTQTKSKVTKETSLHNGGNFARCSTSSPTSTTTPNAIPTSISTKITKTTCHTPTSAKNGQMYGPTYNGNMHSGSKEAISTTNGELGGPPLMFGSKPFVRILPKPPGRSDCNTRSLPVLEKFGDRYTRKTPRKSDKTKKSTLSVNIPTPQVAANVESNSTSRQISCPEAVGNSKRKQSELSPCEPRNSTPLPVKRRRLTGDKESPPTLKSAISPDGLKLTIRNETSPTSVNGKSRPSPSIHEIVRSMVGISSNGGSCGNGNNAIAKQSAQVPAKSVLTDSTNGPFKLYGTDSKKNTPTTKTVNPLYLKTAKNNASSCSEMNSVTSLFVKPSGEKTKLISILSKKCTRTSPSLKRLPNNSTFETLEQAVKMFPKASLVNSTTNGLLSSDTPPPPTAHIDAPVTNSSSANATVVLPNGSIHVTFNPSAKSTPPISNNAPSAPHISPSNQPPPMSNPTEHLHPTPRVNGLLGTSDTIVRHQHPSNYNQSVKTTTSGFVVPAPRFPIQSNGCRKGRPRSVNSAFWQGHSPSATVVARDHAPAATLIARDHAPAATLIARDHAPAATLIARDHASSTLATPGGNERVTQFPSNGNVLCIDTATPSHRTLAHIERNMRALISCEAGRGAGRVNSFRGALGRQRISKQTSKLVVTAGGMITAQAIRQRNIAPGHARPLSCKQAGDGESTSSVDMELVGRRGEYLPIKRGRPPNRGSLKYKEYMRVGVEKLTSPGTSSLVAAPPAGRYATIDPSSTTTSAPTPTPSPAPTLAPVRASEVASPPSSRISSDWQTAFRNAHQEQMMMQLQNRSINGYNTPSPLAGSTASINGLSPSQRPSTVSPALPYALAGDEKPLELTTATSRARELQRERERGRTVSGGTPPAQLATPQATPQAPPPAPPPAHTSPTAAVKSFNNNGFAMLSLRNDASPLQNPAAIKKEPSIVKPSLYPFPAVNQL